MKWVKKDGLKGFITKTSSPIEFTPIPQVGHKDTDLGYFAGLLAANGCDVSVAVWRAKELIKQLDKEVGK